MSVWLEQTTARKPALTGRRWPLWLAGGMIGLAAAMLAVGDVGLIADFLVTRVIEPFSQIVLQGFLCL